MPERWFPLHPDLDQVRRQAKDLLRDFRAGDPEAAEELLAIGVAAPRVPRLADAQRALARSYGFHSWPRLVLSVQMTNAIWADDAETVRALATRHRPLLHHRAHRNWGAPMAFAANLGRDHLVEILHDLGARDVQWAFDRACLQGRLATARRLHALGAQVTPGIVMGPCETQSSAGLELLLDLGAPVCDAAGDRFAPLGLVLETYCRNSDGKHGCLELLARQGLDLPDTAPMAVHRGRIDLLQAHLGRDPALLTRTFTHAEIFPPAAGCHTDPSGALNATPLGGTTLLHQAVDGDEMEIARWLLEHGADPNTRADMDGEGFGGHTALFGCVVSQPHATGRQQEAAMTRLLLEHGADPNVRASLRKALVDTEDDALHEYRDVTPLSWGERFHNRAFVSTAAMALITQAGGRP